MADPLLRRRRPPVDPQAEARTAVLARLGLIADQLDTVHGTETGLYAERLALYREGVRLGLLRRELAAAARCSEVGVIKQLKGKPAL